jgi:sn-glycerol 3-phosphate transport system permease protein
MEQRFNDVQGVSLAEVLRWLTFLIILIFMLWFVVNEADGLEAFGRWLLDAVERIPDFLKAIRDYYRVLSADYLIPSLLVGGIFGAVMTGALYLAYQEVWQLSFRFGWLGFILFVIALYLGAAVWLALLFGVGAMLATSYGLERGFREFLTPERLRQLSQREIALPLGRGVLVGALAGAVGSQVLLYPAQHCTYYANAPSVQYRLGLLITVVSSLLVLLPLWTVMFRRRLIGGEQGTAGYFRGKLPVYLLLLPNLLMLVAFLYYPGAQVVLMSLKARRFPLPQERFVCLNNYVDLSKDVIYRNSIFATAFITLMLVIITMSIALGVAVLASQKVKGAGVYRTLLIWPFALSPVVTGVIFLAMFREGGAGVINAILDSTLGIEPRWLRDENLSPWVIILASVWNGLGFNILFYIAGLQNIPQDLLEAASIDGANRVERFFRITLPLLSPFTFFLLVNNVIYAFYGIYGVVDAITQGGPPLGPGGVEGGATNVLIYKLYGDAFTAGGSAGSAAAQALILFILVAAMTLLQFRYVESRVTYGA